MTLTFVKSIQTNYYNNYYFKMRSIHKLVILSIIILLFLLTILFIAYLFRYIKRRNQKKKEILQLNLLEIELNRCYNNELELYEDIDNINDNNYNNNYSEFNNQHGENRLSLAFSNSSNDFESDYL